MKPFIFGLILTAALSISAIAQTPSDVLKPYKEYLAALDAGDKDKAISFAKLAYENSKQVSGDSSTAGKLAQNYADLIRSIDTNEAIRLYRYAAQVAEVRTQDDRFMQAERLIFIAHNGLLILPDNKVGLKKVQADAYAAWEYVDNLNPYQPPQKAEALAVVGWSLNREDRFDEAIEWLSLARKEFNKFHGSIPTTLKYHTNLQLARALKFSGKPIESALAVQSMMLNTDGDLPKNSPFIARAKKQWEISNRAIANLALEEQAIAMGVHQNGLNTKPRQAKMKRIKVHPPKVPKGVRRSGRVLLTFDLNRKGEPINIKPVATSRKSYIKPAIESLEKWRYLVTERHSEAELLNQKATVYFRLRKRNGNLASEEKLIWLNDSK